MEKRIAKLTAEGFGLYTTLLALNPHSSEAGRIFQKLAKLRKRIMRLEAAA